MIAENRKKLAEYGFATLFIGLFVLSFIIRREMLMRYTMRTYLWGINFVAYAAL